MTSRHFTDIHVTHLTNEDACRANAGSWCVEYKRDGVAKSNGFHTAAVATAFASKLEAGELDDDALSPPASRLVAANAAMRQALEVIASRTDLSPAITYAIALDALERVAL